MDLQNYFPVLLFIIVATLIGFALLAAGRILGPHRPYDEKLSPTSVWFRGFWRFSHESRYSLLPYRHSFHYV